MLTQHTHAGARALLPMVAAHRRTCSAFTEHGRNTGGLLDILLAIAAGCDDTGAIWVAVGGRCERWLQYALRVGLVSRVWVEHSRFQYSLTDAGAGWVARFNAEYSAALARVSGDDSATV